ncbi:glutathione peroxidase [Pseudorhodoferax sp.]|uniref:glutathione peroxidase n=1 Tax=Pseudorhodoferax sp. TaxID=1993553 RepID=UPI002DD643FB|nr:glutathione peroxidase [Pseudorhodoferax sp.]
MKTSPCWVIRLGFCLGLGLATALPAAAACPPLLQHQMLRLQDEKPVDLCGYEGRVVLVVNTASQCGFTPQYKSLETLYSRFSARGLVVLGFPANDFNQEQGSNEAIADFCENQFAVRFPMFVKTTVLNKPGGPAVNPLYAELARSTGQAPKWNFHKYLIGRDGRSVQSVPSATDPLSPAFVAEVEKLLAQPR